MYTAVAPARLSDKAKAEYLGEHFSEEALAFCSIALRDGDLVLQQAPTRKLVLKPCYQDGFTL